MAKDKLLPLKIIVYAMGIMLLGGFLWLGGKLAIKASELSNMACDQVDIPAPPVSHLPLKSLTFQNNHWILTYGDNHNATAYRYNKCGELQQTFTILGG